MTSDYPPGYFEWQKSGSKSSAEKVIPLVLDLIKPKSVLDAGCGTGVWLSVFKQMGVSDIHGIDGDYVSSQIKEISNENFTSLDLEKSFNLNRQFDMVTSLETAEHLSPERANGFIQSLTKHGKVVLFSAAIPYQGGPGHRNEQWPQYWADIFQNLGYVCVDCLREKIWDLDGVEWWYAQNLLIFIAKDKLTNFPDLSNYLHPDNKVKSLVHPNCFLETVSVCEDEIKKKRYSWN